ncbi:class I SAM-dependent methyltransferase [Propionibacteriaceae bacterium Y2011]
MTEAIKLTGAQQTMLGTLGHRVRDARSPRPVLDDTAAVEIAERIGHPFTDDAGHDPRQALVSVARCRQIDDWARPFLHQHPDAVVLHLGSGVDTRRDRLRPGPGVSWFEVDHPDVIALRRKIIPAPPSVTLIGADVTDLTWLDPIPTGRPTLVVAEGLSMYLPPKKGLALVARLVERFDGELIMDVNGSAGRLGQVTNRNVRQSRARWRWFVNDPRTLERTGATVQQTRANVDLLRQYAPGRLSLQHQLGLGVLGAVGFGRRAGQVVRLAI